MSDKLVAELSETEAGTALSRRGGSIEDGLMLKRFGSPVELIPIAARSETIADIGCEEIGIIGHCSAVRIVAVETGRGGLTIADCLADRPTIVVILCRRSRCLAPLSALELRALVT